MDWTLEEAKLKVNEVVDKALHEGPQRILTGAGVVMLISEQEFERIEKKEKSFGEHLLSIPKVNVVFERDRSPGRDIEL